MIKKSRRKCNRILAWCNKDAEGDSAGGRRVIEIIRELNPSPGSDKKGEGRVQEQPKDRRKWESVGDNK